MPKDSKGKFHMNPQLAKMHDRGPAVAQADGAADDLDAAAGGNHAPHPEQGHVSVHPHEDGSFHTVTHHLDGSEPETQQHADMGAVAQHLSAHFGQDGGEGGCAHGELEGDEANDY